MRLVPLAALFTPGAALAHPGSHAETGWLHALTQPDHLAPVAIIAIVGLVAYRFRARR